VTPEDQEIMRLTVRSAVSEGVQAGVEPIWEQIREHSTKIALARQELDQSRASAFAQGERLGDAEHEITKINTHKWWIVGIFGMIKAVILGVLGWLLSRGP